MFSEKINARIAALDKTNLLAIALMGSYARGDAGQYSDIDVVCFSGENGGGPAPFIEMLDGKYLVVSVVSSTEVESWFTQPEKATECIGGLRMARPLWDRDGYFADLQSKAERFVWDEALQAKANLYVSKGLFGWVEEVHKALQGLILGDIGRMLNGLHGLTFGIFHLVRVQRGIFLNGENYFLEEVIKSFGEQSEFARLGRVAFGVGNAFDARNAFELREKVVAGLQLFCLLVEMWSDILSAEVKEGIIFVANEVQEELKSYAVKLP